MATTTERMIFNRESLDDTTLIQLYQAMLKPRLIEEKMLILLRQGRISKWFSGIGQEAIAVGATKAMLDQEYIFPMHRNLGVFTTREIPLKDLFCQWQGKRAGFTKGRDRSFHFGTQDYNIVGMISHLGPQLSLAAGVGLSHQLLGENNVSLAFSGEGGTSEGEFHEALNVAAVWKLPVIFLVENNGYALSTPISEQFNCEQISDKGIGYGMESISIDGNNILEVFTTLDKYAKDIRQNPRPILIECNTFRMRGHEEASGTKYVPQELMDYWGEKDPLSNYEQFLLDEKLITKKEIEKWTKDIKASILTALDEASAEPKREANLEEEIEDLFAPNPNYPVSPSESKTEKRFIDAISEGMFMAMEKHDNLTLMGQDIADYGGVFKITEGFLEAFGGQRVRNTPLCESAIIGIGIGMSIKGLKSMVEMQFADFVTCGFNQIVNNAAKLHYRWGQNVDMVLRMPCGGGVGAGPFHSQTNEAWFYHIPGLKIVYPSSPEDAKGLLLSAFEDPNPVIFFEHKGLYRNISGEVPDNYYTIPIGKGKYVRRGNDLTIVTYGQAVHWAVEYFEEKDIDVEIIDLRSLQPIDYDIITESVQKTSKVIVLHEDTLTGGIGGDLIAYISEHLFEYLDGPPMRCGSADTPVPFASALENDFMANSKLDNIVKKLMDY